MNAGDLRRAKAACERLVLLAADDCPAERRDLAVILLHCGFVSQVSFLGHPVSFKLHLPNVMGHAYRQVSNGSL